ncbi:MAG: hypothetical protein V7K67_06135 [Nostoc sp.]|uniref:hypothetical protein n=1 Tax=Nostoc sp. TaxID=1180 RepID=UPI002FF0C992
MSGFKLSYKPSQNTVSKRVIQFHTATLILLGIVLFSGMIIAGWFAGEDRISRIFAQINYWQMHPPMWLEVSRIDGKYLLLPTLGCLLTVFVVMKISPIPRIWSQRLIVGMLIIRHLQNSNIL